MQVLNCDADVERLDISSLGDVLRSSTDQEWTLADLILAGALDDEYPVSGSGVPSSATPDLIVTRPSIDARPSTAPSSSRAGTSFSRYAPRLGRHSRGTGGQYGRDLGESSRMVRRCSGFEHLPERR